MKKVLTVFGFFCIMFVAVITGIGTCGYIFFKVLAPKPQPIDTTMVEMGTIWLDDGYVEATLAYYQEDTILIIEGLDDETHGYSVKNKDEAERLLLSVI